MRGKRMLHRLRPLGRHRCSCASARQTSAGSAPVSLGARTCARILLLLPKKSLLDLGKDLVEPLLGAVGSLLVISYIRFKLHDSIFGRAKFRRELLCKIKGVLTVRFGYTRRLVQQAQDAATGAVQFVRFV